MDLEAKYTLLKACSLFKDCDVDTLQLIAKDTYHRSYEAGRVILNSDVTIHKISIIVNVGRMKVFTHNPINDDEYIVFVLSHGDLFNTVTLFDDKKDNLSAMAIDKLEILHCNIDLARNWITIHQKFTKNLLQYLSDRLRLTIEYNVSKTFYSLELRLAKLIYQNVVGDTGELNLINDLSHTEIAKMLGTTRTVVNRNLQKLKKDGYIDIKYKEILIADYKKLQDFMKQNDFLS